MGKLQIKVQRHICYNINISETVTDPGERGHTPAPCKTKNQEKKDGHLKAAV